MKCCGFYPVCYNDFCGAYSGDAGKKRLARGLAVCGLFSLMTGTIQLAARIGRFEFDDIFDNLLGAAAGCGAYALAERMRPQIRRVLTKYLRKKVA